MRLYVHFEPSDAALAWTKRFNLPPVDDTSVCPSVRSVLHCFLAAYNAKFRSKTPLAPPNVDVYVEFQQNTASRRLLASLDVSVAAADSSGRPTDKMSVETWDFELVVVPRESQRKVLAPEPPSKLKPNKTRATNAETSEEASRDSKLRGVLEVAASCMKQKKFRAAREIYSEVVLKTDELNAEALVALGDILIANGRHEEAADKFFLRCWKAHGEGNWGRKKQAMLAFTSALRLAECYIQLGKLNEAVGVVDELQALLRVNGGSGGAERGEVRHKVFFSGAEERSQLEVQMDILKAQALYETKGFNNQEKAISLMMQLMPDLTAPTLNLDALLLYARIARDRGKNAEALSMALRVLVNKPNDRAAKKILVSLLKDPGSIELLKSAVPPCGPSAGAAYAFIATILKDFGAMENAIACFQQAQISDSQSASYALNHAHVLEACCRYAEAYDVLVSFFCENQTLSVGNGAGGAAKLTAGSFLEILYRAGAWKNCIEDTSAPLEKSQCNRELSRWRVEWISGHEGYAKVIPPPSASVSTVESAKVSPLSDRTVQANKKASATLSELELDLLACFFTVVKILFVNGRLSVLPSLVRLLEPLRLGRELHRTTIRNEQAYYACIAQLLSIEEALVVDPPRAVSEVPTDVMYVCGDSHTLATAWREINVLGRSTLLRPALVTGLKHWHLRMESQFYPKLNFWRAVSNIPTKARVVFLFGEIDCREGILDAVEKCKYETTEEGMEHTIGIFMKTLADVVRKYKFDVYIHPVVPVLDETRSLVIQYNKIFHEVVAKSTICKWLNFFDDLMCETPPKLRPDFRLDGTHLHPSYLAQFEVAFHKLSEANS
ncbi:hypothetical protein PHYPSEUDO_003959 [Phytophthora pseudosyringae]|uniref:Uncharacterized protein n=1 Tax=Phytophthora pseudosyringae TaxID=221518 RepID=A0A8T1VPB6_9STRA|nr:hypothetical protein PHYPSEUDO_003959 [Phytophthora pseudosyringae]